jgi:hypothetical protein
MIRATLVIVAFWLTGCAYTSTDLALSNYSSNGWEREPLANSSMDKYRILCGENTLHLYVQRILATEGNAYLALGFLPIGLAGFADHESDGFNFSYNYEGLPLSCSNSEVRVSANGIVASEIEIQQAENIKSACVVNVPYMVSKLRKVEIEFPKLTMCRLPSIEFQLNTENNYKYDAIAH